jgi:prevent-host-death family protein
MNSMPAASIKRACRSSRQGFRRCLGADSGGFAGQTEALPRLERHQVLDDSASNSIFWTELLARKVTVMTRRNWSVQDAKNRFSEVVEAARREPQTVTKHGKPAVVVVAVDEYERLRRLQHLKAPSFAELLLAMPTDGEEFERLEGRMREPGF